LIASGSYDTQIKIWDHRKKENIATKQINSIDISPDGRYLLSASEDGTSKFWDIGTQKIINTYSEHTAPVLKAIFNP
jgi:WD40 repeat protein